MQNAFYCLLSQLGNDFDVGSVTGEIIFDTHTESMQKCLKFEYLCKFEIFSQHSRVTGPWGHKDLVNTSCLYTFKNVHLNRKGQSIEEKECSYGKIKSSIIWPKCPLDVLARVKSY